ncbi:MAG: acyl-CoA dehydrogenase family protein [Candidatus Marinimicrobia bacterium]|jgi:glutaryl-CoA dehydrogenase|nr:acyl-CoA dehydrogenase family protein [Candidatus Neomarinimicrobiota bacterium]MDP7025775.1 acyl-CoA dehydrogenase family protein [Candidatus Neomarinimicrobiota bacterium]|tara:strand:+ start:4675 stop:5847 length:1173 start_codon:yes stop_codon:yes gene_type:complete
MSDFLGTDYYNLDTLLSEEELAVQKMTREFVESEFMPVVTAHHRDGTFPTDLIPMIGELGFFGANLPEEYGCAGLNNVAYGLVMYELERGDSGLRSMASVQGGLVMYPIYSYGSEEQKQQWLPRLAKGEAIGCFGLTEPDFGSDPSGMITRAQKTDDGYALNGSKMWITNGTIADVAVVWAKDDEGVIRGFLVEQGTPGFTTQKMHGKFSLRASDTAELIFDDCHIPEENVFPGVQGMKGPLSCLTQARYGIAWGTVGAAAACYEIALKYAQERIQFEKPIASFQLIQKNLVDMVAEITKAQLLVLQLGRLKDQDRMRHQQVSMAKMNNVAMARDIARTARETLGANGIMDDYHIIRHMMNLESVYTYEGTHEIHTLVVGADITGIDAFR